MAVASLGAPRFRLGTARGLAGQTPGAMALGHRVRDGELPKEVADTGEIYDLVVVGAGIAGLASAFLYDQEAPGRAFHPPSRQQRRVRRTRPPERHGVRGREAHRPRRHVRPRGRRGFSRGGARILPAHRARPREARRVPGREVPRAVRTLACRGLRLEGLRGRRAPPGSIAGTRLPYEAFFARAPSERRRAKGPRRALHHAKELPSRSHGPRGRAPLDELGAIRSGEDGPG